MGGQGPFPVTCEQHSPPDTPPPGPCTYPSPTCEQHSAPLIIQGLHSLLGLLGSSPLGITQVTGQLVHAGLHCLVRVWGEGGGGKITHSASRRSLDSLSMLTCNAWCVRVCVWGVCVGGGRSLDSPGAYMLIHSLTGGRGTFLCVCMCVHTCVLNLTVQPNGRPTAIPVTHVYVQAVFRVN